MNEPPWMQPLGDSTEINPKTQLIWTIVRRQWPCKCCRPRRCLGFRLPQNCIPNSHASFLIDSRPSPDRVRLTRFRSVCWAQTFASYRGTLAPMTDFTVCYWINFRYHHRWGRNNMRQGEEVGWILKWHKYHPQPTYQWWPMSYFLQGDQYNS